MAISRLSRDLIAVNQAGVQWIRALRGIVEMSIAESAGHGDRRARIDGLDRIQDGGIREPRNGSDRPELTGAEALRSGRTASLFSGTQTPGCQDRKSVV